MSVTFRLFCAGRLSSNLKPYLGHLYGLPLCSSRFVRCLVSSLQHSRRPYCGTLPIQFRIPTLKVAVSSSRPGTGQIVHRIQQRAAYSPNPPPAEPKRSYTQRIKVVLKEYGPVAVVFHTVISLISLGTCYFLVSRQVACCTVMRFSLWAHFGTFRGQSSSLVTYRA
jgi:hypothetical protein